MRLSRVALVPLAGLVLSCADVSEIPELAGANIAAVDFHPQSEGTVRLLLSVADRNGYPWVDMETARFYVRQVLNTGTAVRTIIDPAEPTADCGWVREVSAPATVALVIDRSRTAGDLVDHLMVRGAAEAARSVDEVTRIGVVSFGEAPSVDLAPTADDDAVETALVNPGVTSGRAALLPAIGAGVALVAEQRAAGDHVGVVVLTASLDDVSGAELSLASVADDAAQRGVPVYIVAYGDAAVGAGSDLWALDDVAAKSGGRFMDGVDPVYAAPSVVSVLDSVRAAYDLCIPGLVVDHGERYADTRDMAEISMTVESAGSAVDTVRLF